MTDDAERPSGSGGPGAAGGAGNAGGTAVVDVPPGPHPTRRPLVRIWRTLCAVASLVTFASSPVLARWAGADPHGIMLPDVRLVDLLYLAVCLLYVPLLPLVSYRRRDVVLMALIPLWGLILAAQVGYRLAVLPLRDWPPRPDEAAAVRPVADAPGVYRITRS